VIDDELQFNRFRLDNKGNNDLSLKFVVKLSMMNYNLTDFASITREIMIYH